MERLNTEILAPGILLMRDVCPWADEVVALSEEVAGWQDALQITPEGTRADSRRNCQDQPLAAQFDSRMTTLENRMKVVAGAVRQRYLEYNKYMGATHDQGYRVVRYKPGQHYHEHIDWTFGMLDVLREFSMTLGLNDGYTGGEIEFPLHGLRVRVPKGSALVFPSFNCFPHAALDVSGGVRYSLVTWFFYNYRLNLQPIV